MRNESPDEFASWRSRLGQPDALPEQGLDDKEAAWDRLSLQLGEKPRRRLYGYRIAAACLLISLIPVSHLFHGRPDAGTVRRVAPLPATPVVSVAPPPSRPAETLHPVGPQPVARRTKPRSAAIAPPALAETAPSPAASPSLAVIVPPPVTALPQAAAARPAPKKQWKVTNLNELNPGRQMPHGMANRDRPEEEDTPLKINLNNQNR